MPHPMITKAAPFTISGTVGEKFETNNRPSTKPSAVANSPGPMPPSPLTINTAGTKNRKGDSSPRTGTSMTRAAKASATAAGAIP
jgi:hypothetical protein